MSTEIISELRLESYAALLSSVYGSACELEFIEAKPVPVSKALKRRIVGPEKPDLSIMLRQSCWSPVVNGVERYAGPSSFLLLRTWLALGAEETGYWLTARLPVTTPAISDAELSVRAEMLLHLSGLLSDDYTQNLMLDGMARELAIRYEELHVLYGLEDLASGDANNLIEESKALTRLIENCLDYLPVDLVAIIIPADSLVISNIDSSSNHFSAKSIIEFLSTEILDRVKARGETLVINQDEVTDWAHLEMELPIKFIASPIFSADKKVCGIFTFTNSLNKTDFSNSDRKLCDVFAVEIGNIIKSKLDELTGLLSRRGLENKLNDIINRGRESYMLHLNIDQFSVVNDASGFSVGDRLLQHVGSVLKSLFDDSVALARLGSDEFVVVLEDASEEDARGKAAQIQHALKDIDYFTGDKLFEINVSMGIVSIGAEGLDPPEILKTAQLACQSAKKYGGARIRVYDPTDKDVIEQHLIAKSANQVNDALLNDRLVLYAQAIVPAKWNNNTTTHFEVLVRMLDENSNVISPGLFIPAAERYKMMSSLDKKVVSKAIEVLSAHNHASGNNSVILSINISGQSIGDDRFKHFVIDEIRRADILPQQICLEITETAAISNLSVALDFIKDIRSLGCTFALDDFGAGMSSFNYLKHMPIDYLKIDGQFVKNITEQNIDATMVEAMNNIGHVMGLHTIAEFVENSEIQHLLTKIGVDYLQGYGLHKPEPILDALNYNSNLESGSRAAG